MCQLSLMENCNADQEHLHKLMITKEATAVPAAPPSSSLSSPAAPCANSAHDGNEHPPFSEDTTTKVFINAGDHPILSLNLITSCPQEDGHECTPGSPEFFLPANAYISLDDPSSLLTSYTSPSDPNSMIWPNPISPSSALLNCPSIFSAGTSSDEGSISCEQIPSHVDIGSQILYNTSNCGFSDTAFSYSALLQSHHPASLFHINNMQQPNFNGFNQMMQGSPNHPYYSTGSSPFAAFQGSNYANAAAYRSMTPNVFAPNTRAGMLEQCLNQAQHEQEEQSWHTFLQPNQEDDHPARLEKVDAINTSLRGSSAVMMMPADFQHHHHHRADFCSPHPSMPMVNHGHHQTMEDPNAGSPTESHMMMQSMQAKRSQDRAHNIDSAGACCTSSNKRRTPDGEDSWPSAEAHECSPPLKMKRSPSFSSSTTSRPQDHHMHNAINSTPMNNYSCTNSATLSPTRQFNSPTKPSNNMTGSPTLSNNQLDVHQPQRKPGKASTRQSVCNDPQSVAARHRRERISERLKTLQQLVPNGAKVDLVTMLEKAISYVKSLQLQVKVLSTDEYWPTPLSDKYSLNNLAAMAKLAASTYN